MIKYILILAFLFSGPIDEQPPANLAKAFVIINDGRVKEGLPPFKWSSKLNKSAQELADWGWAHYDVGPKDPHHNFLERMDKIGWKWRYPNGSPIPGPSNAVGQLTMSECGIDGSSDSRGEDGKVYPPDSGGWYHPYRTAESHANNAVWALTKGISDPNEVHRRDFHDKWTHIGLGYNNGMFIIDYGIIVK